MYKTYRQRSSKRNGSGFDEVTINAVWQKGQIDYTKDFSGTFWRRDSCGALMRRADYGNTNSTTGWEIDHIKPVSVEGTDDLYNLQPLQWENNRHKGDDYPNWYCLIRS